METQGYTVGEASEEERREIKQKKQRRIDEERLEPRQRAEKRESAAAAPAWEPLNVLASESTVKRSDWRLYLWKSKNFTSILRDCQTRGAARPWMREGTRGTGTGRKEWKDEWKGSKAKHTKEGCCFGGRGGEMSDGRSDI